MKQIDDVRSLGIIDSVKTKGISLEGGEMESFGNRMMMDEQMIGIQWSDLHKALLTGAERCGGIEIHYGKDCGAENCEDGSKACGLTSFFIRGSLSKL